MPQLELGAELVLGHLAWWGAPLVALLAFCLLSLRLGAVGQAQRLSGQRAAAPVLPQWARLLWPLWFAACLPVAGFRGEAGCLGGSALGLTAGAWQWHVGMCAFALVGCAATSFGSGRRACSHGAEPLLGGCGLSLVWGLAGAQVSLLSLLILLEVASFGLLLLLVYRFLQSKPQPAAARQGGGSSQAIGAFAQALLVFFWLATLASFCLFWALAAGFQLLGGLSLGRLVSFVAAPQGGGETAMRGAGLALGLGLALKLALPPLQLGVLLFYQQVGTQVLGAYLLAYYVPAIGLLFAVLGLQLGVFLAPWFAVITALGVATGLAISWSIEFTRDLRGVLGASTVVTLTLLSLACAALATLA